MESLGAVVVIVVYGFGFFGNVFDKFARILYIDETAADNVRFPVQFILVGRKITASMPSSESTLLSLMMLLSMSKLLESM